MGHQLVFWSQEQDGQAARDVYRSLVNDRTADGLRSLPLASILRALVSEFPEIDPEPTVGGQSPAFWQDGQTVVEFSWSDIHVVAELRPAGLWSGEVANRVIDVLKDFQLPLYDPQTNERFDSWLTS